MSYRLRHIITYDSYHMTHMFTYCVSYTVLYSIIQPVYDILKFYNSVLIALLYKIQNYTVKERLTCGNYTREKKTCKGETRKGETCKSETCKGETCKGEI